MSNIIVISFVTLDGVMEDPDGSDDTPNGGWAFRQGPKAVTDDKFRLGRILDTGVLLFGHTTWTRFSQRWPTRTGPFATAMNRIPKVVASHRTRALDAWNNSSLLEGDLVDAARALAVDRDVVVVGSMSVVHQLAAADAVDEYRLLVMPTALGTGTRLFDRPTDLQLTEVDASGPGVFARYRRA